MSQTNNDIYDFANDQIEHNVALIPRDEWIKWLSEKQYSQEEVKHMINHAECEQCNKDNKLHKKDVRLLQKEILQNVHVLLQAHSGRNWHNYTPDTAVTEYRALIKTILEEKINSVFSKNGIERKK